ncbi:non-ribosomal peptide synthetase [Pedobacter steynii]|uniref:Carrier domain-containing protein n=1 Tax=Pedobacter steynii TaxID=430522 RepID=A0A1D7QNC8_9SPHI|nr:non-ribosomal peptide synthetase [Pedobacter steynii]AOM80165.1 hypothetical protein BFS30_25190 [Pedobacter steynii]
MSKKIDKSNVSEIVELNLVQQGMLFHFLKETDQSLYNVQITLQLEGDFEESMLLESLKVLQANNEILRSVFRWEEVRKPIQLILRECPFIFNFHDLSAAGMEQKEEFIQAYLKEDQQTRFDLTELPVRFHLIRTGSSSQLFTITHHHILYDGWSTGILLKEIFENFFSVKNERLPVLLQKPSYLAMQKASFLKSGGDAGSGYWKQYLDGYSPKSLFNNTSYVVNAGALEMNKVTAVYAAQKLRSFAASYRVTPATVVYAAFGILLRKYLNCNDVVIGTVVSCRAMDLQDADRVMGNFINTLPLRINEQENKTIGEVIENINVSLVRRNEFIQYAYSEIKEIAGLTPAEELFDAVVVIENYPIDTKALKINDQLDIRLHSVSEKTEIPLLLNVFFKEEVEFEFIFQPNIPAYFDQVSFSRHLIEILDDMMLHPDRHLKSINLLSPEENKQLISDFNQTGSPYPEIENVITLFQEQVKLDPNRKAVQFNDFVLNYAQLDELSSQFAHYLKVVKKVKKGDLIGILLEREAYLIPAIYGVIKAGCAYVPIDPGFPAERLASIVEDSGMQTLISRSHHIPAGILNIGNLVNLDLDLDEIKGQGQFCEVLSGADLVYVIYTSGSTGKPKGVMISHDSLTSRLWWMQKQYPLSGEDVMLLKTPIIFDISIWEIFCWSFTGASLIVLPHGGEKDPPLMVEFIRKFGITTLHFVPSLLGMFLNTLNEGFDFSQFSGLKIVFACGEALLPLQVQSFRNSIHKYCGTRLINLYGPAEATLDASYYECRFNADENNMIPIGKPLDNVNLYILDIWGYPVPVGVTAELCIGGIGLALGYLNNKSLSAEKFIDQPAVITERIYKTGDLARWMPDGNIEFLGRVDNQIKLRGFRIELGEIESQLLSLSGIKEAVVLKRQQNEEDYLVAYYIPSGTAAIPDLHQFLLDRLPQYMVPHYFIMMEEFPLLVSGKLDRKSLPDPVIEAGADYVAASTETESRLVSIWSGVLRLDISQISINRSFFELGGHSLRAMAMVNEINRTLNIRVSLNDVFKYPTVQTLAGFINGSDAVHFQPIIAAVSADFYPLSPAQQRLYFLNEFNPDSSAYNGSLVTEIKGPLNIHRLKQAFQKLLDRHEILRTYFTTVDGVPVQKIVEDYVFELEMLKSEGRKQEEIIRQFVRPFDLGKLPLFRIALIEMMEEEHLLIFDIHHIISDGLSQEILIKDFTSLYNGYPLNELMLQYKDFAMWQNDTLQQERISSQRKFWNQLFDQIPDVLELPIDFPRSSFVDAKAGKCNFNINENLVQQLQVISDKHGLTMYMLMLSVYNLLLSKLCNAEDIVVGTPVSGRDYPGLENIPGMFVNTIPLRNLASGEMRFDEFILSVKKRAAEAFSNQSFPYNLLVEDLRLERDNSHNPLFDTLFTYQDFKEERLSIPDLDIYSYDAGHQFTQFDLILSVTLKNGELSCFFEYSADLFRQDTIERFVTYFHNILESVVHDDQVLLSRIAFLPLPERQLLTEHFNNTKVQLPAEDGIISVFKKCVREYPERTALIHDQEKITYRQLEERVNAVSLLLQEKVEGKTEQRVALLFQPSTDMSVAILAVLNCGCTFVPLSPEAPLERNAYIIADSEAVVLLTNEAMNGEKDFSEWPLNADQIIFVGDAVASEIIMTECKVSDDRLIYIIYTSGTTGEPKGVGVNYGNVMNFAVWNRDSHCLTPSDVTLQLVPYHFDGFGANFYSVFISGGAMVSIPVGQKYNSDYIVDVIQKNKVTNFAVLPSFYGEILTALKLRADQSTDLRFVTLGGEAATDDILSRSAELLAATVIENQYGPTETTIAATCNNNLLNTDNRIIGKPIFNTQIWILNRHDEMVPIGVKGDLCISGAGVTNGYLNAEQLTAEKFRRHPFLSGQKFYRTGDLARWLPDGNIEIFGRIDDQVKIRGFRVELAEIEVQLVKHPEITAATVVAIQKDNQTKLAAYYVSQVPLADVELRDFLAHKLPDYMVPAHFCLLGNLPYTSLGKIDRKALPLPIVQANDQYLAAETENEQLLAGIWAKTLSLEKVGVNDNFFAIGGDSIKSIQVCSQVHAAGFELSVKDIFTWQSIAKLALQLKKRNRIADQSAIIGETALSPIQHWFMTGVIRNKNHFNQSVLLSFKDSVSLSEIRTIFSKLLEHHDVLRSKFVRENDKYVQKISSFSSELSVHELFIEDQPGSDELILSMGNRAQSDFDITAGGLVKLILFQVGQESRLMVIIHHLVIDLVSWRILFEDIQTLLQQVKSEAELLLPLKTDPYHLWVGAVHESIDSNPYLNAISYWSQLPLKGNPLPKDHGLGTNTIGKAKEVSFKLSVGETDRLLGEANLAFGTRTEDLLLAAMLLAYKEQFAVQEILVDLERHGRDPVGQLNISRTIGWFTAVYPILLNSAHDSLKTLLIQVKEALRTVPEYSQAYLLSRFPGVESEGEVNVVNSSISFNYSGQFDTDVSGKSFEVRNDFKWDHIGVEETRLYEWEFSGLVVEGTLQLSLSYSGEQYFESRMNSFMHSYQQSLLNIIEYCCSAREKVVTPSDFTYSQLTMQQLESLSEAGDIEDIYPLSQMQEGLLFHHLLDADTDSYFEQATVFLEGTVDFEAVKRTMALLASRHVIFRTLIRHRDMKRPVQMVLKEKEVAIRFTDASDLNVSADEILSSYKIADRLEKFDFDQGALIRLHVIKTGPEKFALIWSHHHILMDGWCMGIILKEFKLIYDAYLSKHTPVLDEVYPYVNFINWLENRDKKPSLAYWSNYLDGFKLQTGIPQQQMTSGVKRFENRSFTIGRKESQQLYDFAKKYEVTVNHVFQLAWGLLLSKYNRSNDCLFGTVVSGRPAEVQGIENMVGLFINTVPVRIQIKPEELIADALIRIRTEARDRESHNYTFLQEIQACSLLKKNLFDHILVFENYPLGEKEGQDHSFSDHFKILKTEIFDQTHYDLAITIVPGADFCIKVNFNIHQLPSDMVEDVLRHFAFILGQLSVKNAQIPVGLIEILEESDRQHLLYEFNKSEGLTLSSGYVPDLFNKQVRLNGSGCAVEAEGLSMTYLELDELSNQVAHYLTTEKGIQPGHLVGVLLAREYCLLPVILGVLKSGAAFIPIDIHAPAERVVGMLTDAHAQLLIMRDDFGLTLPSELQVSDLNKDWEAITSSASEASGYVVKEDSLAYVIYTSGSTGQPKGVMISHRALADYVKWADAVYVNGATSVFPLYSSIGFDLTITSIFVPLISGNTIRLYDHEESALLINHVLLDHKATVLKLTPSHLKIIRANFTAESLSESRIRTLIVGGEELESGLTAEIHELFGGRVNIFNEYGPTEATVGCMLYQYDPADGYLSVPIGSPADHMQIYTLDEHLQPVPFGAPGEIYISGSALSEGYLNNALLTAEKFIPNPFVKGSRMYKTGDLAIRVEGNKLIYKGRIDQQVQLRGFRIELEEICYALQLFAGIKEAHVSLLEVGEDQYLVAYYVADERIDERTLRSHIAELLPDYMHPSYYVELHSFPLTSNGKLDVKLLPKPVVELEADHIAPTGAIEEQLAEIWSSVLGIDKALIGRNRSFFELGGHSLKAVNLINQISKEMGAGLRLKDVFNYPTIRGLGELPEFGTRSQYQGIGKAAKQPYYRLSSAQKRMYLLYQLDRESLAYNMPHLFRLEGAVDLVRLEDAFSRLISRHGILRTVFEQVGEEPVQSVLAPFVFKVSCFTAADQSELAAVSDLFIRPFDLEEGPLLRVGLVCLSAEEHVLMIDMHHIITDGISQEILIREFMALYQGADPALPELQYIDYAEWQYNRLQEHGQEADKAYWLNRFSAELPVLNLPLDEVRPLVKDHKGGSVQFMLTAAESQALKKLADEQGSTVFMVLLCCWNLLLFRLSGQRDIVVGSPAAGRNHAGLEQMAGMFVNTLALRTEIPVEQEIQVYLQQLSTAVLDDFAHQDYQYEELIGALHLERDTSRNPLFDVMFVLQNYEMNELQIPGLTLSPLASPHQLSKFDLLLSCTERSGCLCFDLDYASALFLPASIDRYIGYLRRIIDTLCRNPETIIGDLDILPAVESEQLLNGFNQTERAYPSDGNLISLFEAQVARNPEQRALRFGQEELSYGALNKLSGQVSAYLHRQCGVASGSLVGILLERDSILVPAIYGVLKSGCAYVPIDPHYPVSRMVSILEDSGLKAVLTRGSCIPESLKENPLFRDLFIDLDVVLDDILLEEALSIPVKGSDLAYVIYTSGSTGKPKGVMIEHHSVVNRLLWMQDRYGIGASDLLIQKTPISFDVSVWELFWWSVSGAGLYVPEPGVEKDASALLEVIGREGVTTIHFVPSMLGAFLQMLVQEESPEVALQGLRQVFTSGEALPSVQVSQFRDYIHRYTGSRLINLYGPTEATVDVSYYECDFSVPVPFTIPIGRPIDNTRFYILDPQGKVVPLGVSGELCIAGVGLARGYLGNAGLTDAKFRFSAGIKGERLYHSGDLARWSASGEVEFLGRIDHQVKLRGQRIELEEIGVHLSAHEQIGESVVLLLEQQGEQSLVAYYISSVELGTEELRSFLSGKLPSYMLPSYFIRMDVFPLTGNGKLDRKRLPAPELLTGSGSYVAASGAIEQQLLEIWSEVLKIEAGLISIDHSFFDLGGHSLRALSLINQIKNKLLIKVSLQELFTHNTIKSQAQVIAQKDKITRIQIPRVEQSNRYPASSAQERLYYQQLLHKEDLSYNISGIFELQFDADVNRLEVAFDQLTARHEVLRTSFFSSEDRLYQIVQESGFFKLETQEQNGQDTARLYQDFIRPFDPSENCFFRAKAITQNDKVILLMVDIHHMICDGISLNLLMKDFNNLCEGIITAEPEVRYIDYSVWQQDGGDELKKQKQYWTNVFSVPVVPLSFPDGSGHHQPDQDETGLHRLIINHDDYHQIKKMVAQYNTTEFVLLLSVYYILLSKITGYTDLIIGSDVSGRTDAGLTNTVGSFVNLLPLRVSVSADAEYGDFLKEVKSTVISAFDHQDFQFDQIVAIQKSLNPGYHQELIKVHFAFSNYIESQEEERNKKMKPIDIKRRLTTQYELKIDACEKDGTYQLDFIYKTSLHDQEFVEALADYYQNILKSIVKDNFITINNIELEAEVRSAFG